MNATHTTKKSLGGSKSARRHKLVVHRDTIGRLDPLEANDDHGKKRSGGHDCPSTGNQQQSGCETCHPPHPHPPHPKK
ncbi:MAG TPA: hypothetical protein VHW23_29480 [Kofleriaceae bacterium]|jgi:hypothetical protein|nr:hypothetical protein [Kofleriaceae bacterium]